MMLMQELLTSAEMREIEGRAIAGGAVTASELMERAGQGTVEAMLDWRPGLFARAGRALILCGPGNNGGDGFVIARLLKTRGWEVELYLYGCAPAEISRLPPDAAVNARRWRDVGEILPLDSGVLRRLESLERVPDVLIDALFGTGLTRGLSGSLSALLAELADRIDPASVARVAVDSPSGLCMDSGRVLGPAGHFILPADLTVSFHRPKLGHFLGDGPAYCGALRVVDIGLPQGPSGARLAGAQKPLLDKGAPRSGRAHKYDHGHALILSGGRGKGGAARLAARGSLRIGAGLVTLGCPPEALSENAAVLDAIMLEALPGAEEITGFLSARKVGAVCIGPGFGEGPRLRAFLAAILTGPRVDARINPPPVVLDADALSEFAHDPETLFAMLHGACVLTPHEGEFGRLFPDLLLKPSAPAVTGPAYSRLDAAREAAARAGCVILLKGADTVIADPSGRAAISAAAYERAVPWLATAGAGDVLAGFITGLLARGVAPFEAAEAASFLHVESALQFGPGLIAEDLPEQLPAVLRRLGF